MPLQVPSENVALCTAIVEVGRVAAARLTVRDAVLGFSKLTPPQRTALAGQADRWSELASALVSLWRSSPIDRPARRLAAMVPDDDALLLLALAAAPQLDRTLARAYASLIGAAPGATSVLSVGVLLDLATPVFEHRLGLAAMLHGQAALRGAALVELRGGDVAQLADELAVAGSAIAALRGEPIAPGVEVAAERAELEPELVAIVEASMTLPRWRPGAVAVVSGPPRDCAAILTLRAALDRRPSWRTDVATAPHTACRDAALAGAQLGIAVGDLGRPLFAALDRAAASTRAAVVLTSDGGVPAGLPADTLQLQARAFHRTAAPAISGHLTPGPVRSALEILGY